ncbi:hypothetical protein J4573_03000 [Actinomadura barringtoniae]|uniref:Nitroreductase n=1 Tax=Actinomadura barringtoniae TaxID=1427535 RepID=A0A939P6T9_9ACTN|nr:hypothetical protein [Actinomadura barringtoniae]
MEKGQDSNDRRAGEVRSAVEAATWAPSVHNTQPWLFSFGGDRISLRADGDRRLGVADPDGREMLISCGAALFTLRVAVRDLGYEPEVRVLPDPDRPHLLADLYLGARTRSRSDDNSRLFEQIRRRRTHRGAFKPEPVGDALLTLLRQEAQREGAMLRVLEDQYSRNAVAALTVAAENMHHLSPSYAGELARWAPSPGSTRQEGVPESAYPREAPPTDPHFPARDFARGHGWGTEPSILDWLEEPVAGVACTLSTKEDRPVDWLRAGQAMQRVLLRATQHGDVAAAFHTQALEVPGLRELIQTRFCAGDHPQMVLRLGTVGDKFETVRRPVEQVLTEES